MATGRLTAAEPTKQELEFFEKKIRPVLVNKCYKCHSAKSEDPKGGLLLDTRAGIRAGGDSGHGVVPGRPQDSLVLDALRYESFEMPPDEQLADTVVADFEKWIQMGAPDPRNGKKTEARRIDIEAGRQFWAFQPVKLPEIPDSKSTTPIDALLEIPRKAAGLSPVETADPRTLVRRLYFDLVGLPPTPAQVEEFVSDPSPAAYDRLVDQLLDSPQYGERWGRHWLDVVRYAESTGMERNYTFPHAWRYRDYVIKSYNEDKPFPEFVREQLAGDLLPATSPGEKSEHLAATAMLALGPKSLNEPNREQFAMDVVDDQIDVTSRAFLGITVACARCHDHKFDPFPTAEYYSLAGIFRSTATHFGTGNGAGNRNQGSLIALQGDAVSVFAAKGKGKNNKANANSARVTTLQKQVSKLNAQLKSVQDSTSAKNKARRERIEKQLASTRKLLAAARKAAAPNPEADNDKPSAGSGARQLLMGVLEGKPADTAIRLRGEPNDQGKTVPRGFLSVVSFSKQPEIPADHSGRLQLADWIVNDANPLTARVAVNRIWQHLFGRGIVGTVNNFGANGERPTHPELLDYLATQFVKNGWSTKAMIREIVTSQAYQRSCESNGQLIAADPDNNLYCRQNQRRLEAEAIRDAMLAVSGELNLTPAQGSVVSRIGDGDVGRGINDSVFREALTQRSVYLPIVRGAVPEVLTVFDFPEPSMIAGTRDVTTVPTQALFLLNSPFVLQQSKSLAGRVLQASDDVETRIQTLFALTLSRPPAAAEIAAAKSFIQAATTMNPRGSDNMDADTKAWTGLCHALLASAEFRYLQ